MSDPHLIFMDQDLPAPIPAAVEQIAEVATDLVLKPVVRGEVCHLLLLAFKGASVRWWELHEPTDPDDLVRAIIQRDQPEAIAFVHPVALPAEVQGDRGYRVAVEAPSGKFDRLIALRGGEGPGGEEARLYGRLVEGDGYRWLGVPPEHDVELWIEGPVGMVGPRGES